MTTLSLAQPGFLWLLLVPPLLVWRQVRRRRLAYRLPSLENFSVGPVGRSVGARWGGAVLRGLALSVIVLGLAQPRIPDLRTRIDAEGVAVEMVVDVSGSMAERDFDWDGAAISRLDAVKRVFRLFVMGGDAGAAAGLEGRRSDPIGLVTFATRPEAVCPLTLSHSAVLQLLESETPRSTPGESETNLSDALAVGLHRLQAAGARRKVLVLLTDGEHNVAVTQSAWTPRQAGAVAAGLGIPIYTIDAGGIGVGAEVPSASPGETRDQAVRALRELAKATGGRYFAAHDTSGLLEACRAIDALERTDFQSYQFRRYHELAPWLGLAAFGIWTAATVLEMTVWRRLP